MPEDTNVIPKRNKDGELVCPSCGSIHVRWWADEDGDDRYDCGDCCWGVCPMSTKKKCKGCGGPMNFHITGMPDNGLCWGCQTEEAKDKVISENAHIAVTKSRY